MGIAAERIMGIAAERIERDGPRIAEERGKLRHIGDSSRQGERVARSRKNCLYEEAGDREMAGSR
jgi:hypothetical protein